MPYTEVVGSRARMWLWVGVLGVVGSCGGEVAPAGGSGSSTSITVLESSTSPEVPTSTTTSTAVEGEHEFSIQGAPPNGTFFREPFTDWPMWGQVRPEADVIIDGLFFTNRMPLDQMHPGTDPEAWGWNSYAPDGGATRIPLSVGPNTITLRAEFIDGTVLTEERVVEHDPTLERATGYITGSGSPSSVTLGLVELGYGEFGVEATGDTEAVEIEVAERAIFIFLVGGRATDLDEFWVAFGLPEFLELLALDRHGVELTDFYYSFIGYSEALDAGPAPWEFLITADGALQQAVQLYSP